MSANKNIREKILNQPSYWIEGINGYLYDAIVNYMEQHNMKQIDLAKHLEISPGRVSQILNDGEINFSLRKIIQIALKVEKFPVFEFEDKVAYLERGKSRTGVEKTGRNTIAWNDEQRILRSRTKEQRIFDF